MAKVLFVGAHPDDETLGFGVPIIEHLKAVDSSGNPLHEVHVLLMDRSVGSVVTSYLNGLSQSSWWGLMHNPTDEGYLPLTNEQFGQARFEEFTNALNCMSSGLGNITIHEANLSGGYDSTTAMNTILTVADSIDLTGPVSLKGHSYIVDNHPDHIAIGEAIRMLAINYASRFAGPRYYILPQYWTDSRLSQVVEHWDQPTDNDVKARATNACRAYGAWNPIKGSYAIGWHSVWANMFSPLMADIKSMYHT